MNSEYELKRLRELKEVYDRTFLVCDPITHMWRLQALLQAIAEHLIQPLQEHEMAERSKLKDQKDWIAQGCPIGLKKPRKKKNAT